MYNGYLVELVQYLSKLFRPNCSYIRLTSTPQSKASKQELNCLLENVLYVYNILDCLYYENKDHDNEKVGNS